MSTVTLKCTSSKCPRSLKLDFDSETMPEGTAYILSKCPWHQDNDFGEEYYFDKNHNELSLWPADKE